MASHSVEAATAPTVAVKYVLEVLNYYEKGIEHPCYAKESTVPLTIMEPPPIESARWSDYDGTMSKYLDAMVKEFAIETVSESEPCAFCQKISGRVSYSFGDAAHHGFLQHRYRLPRLWLACVLICSRTAALCKGESGLGNTCVDYEKESTAVDVGLRLWTLRAIAVWHVI